MNDARAEDEAAYVLAVEERFREKRETPLLLSPADFQRALAWFREGVPLFVVLQAIEDVFRRAAEKKPRRTPLTLAFVEPAVREGFAAWQERRLGAREGDAGAAAGDADAALFAEAAAKVEASSAPAPARAAAADALRARTAPVGAVERALVDACLAALAADERAALEAAASADIASFAATMEPAIRARAEQSAVRRRVRARFALPDLGLLPGL